MTTPQKPKSILSDQYLQKKRQGLQSEKKQGALVQYRNDPEGFFRNVLGASLWDRQAELIQSVQAHDWVAVSAGHKVSKSFTAVGLALWFVATRPGEKVRAVMTSGKMDQLKATLWKELRYFWSRIRHHFPTAELAKDPATGLQFADGREIIGLTAKDPEKMAGLSGDEQFFILDEASGIPAEIFEAILGNTAGGAKILALSQPSQTDGFFFEAFHKENSEWHTLRISSEESPNFVAGKKIIPGLANRDWVLRMQRQFGGEYHSSHPVYMVRVQGRFPPQASDSVIALATVEDAKSRWSHEIPESDLQKPLRVGVDVARYGDDETVIQLIRGSHALRPIVLRQPDGFASAKEILRIIRQHMRGGETFPTVNVDGIGVGAAVVDGLRNLRVPVRDVWVSRKADQEDDYFNLRSEVWFGVQDWLESGGTLPPDEKLEIELLAPRYLFDNRGRIKIELKDDIKKRLKRSPDRADALALAIYRPKRREGARVLSGRKYRTAGLGKCF